MATKKLTFKQQSIVDTLLEVAAEQGSSTEAEILQQELADRVGILFNNMTREMKEIRERTNGAVYLISPGRYSIRGLLKQGTDLPEPKEEQRYVTHLPIPSVASKPTLAYSKPAIISSVKGSREVNEWLRRYYRNFAFDILKAADAFIPTGKEAKEAFDTVNLELAKMMPESISDWTAALVKEVTPALVQRVRDLDTREVVSVIPPLNDRIDTSCPVDEYRPDWLHTMLCSYPNRVHRSCLEDYTVPTAEEDPTWADGVRLLAEQVKTKYNFDVMYFAIKAYRAAWVNGGADATYIKPLMSFLKTWTLYANESRRFMLMSDEDQTVYEDQLEEKEKANS